MNKKYVVGILLFLIFIVCIGIGIYIQKISEITDTKITKIAEVAERKVTDECTSEGNELEVNLNLSEKKISPDAVFVIKKKFKKCGHETKEYEMAPQFTVNMTEEELKKVYKGYEIESFSNHEVVLSKEEEGICDEHFVLRENQGQIVVYGIGSDDSEKIVERTGIIVNYLPEEDREKIKNGIFVNGNDSLNRVIEDYE